MLVSFISDAENGLIHVSEVTKLELRELKTPDEENQEKVSNLKISSLSSPTSNSAAPSQKALNVANMEMTSEFVSIY